jgi:hypothetical protein
LALLFGSRRFKVIAGGALLLMLVAIGADLAFAFKSGAAWTTRAWPIRIAGSDTSEPSPIFQDA